MSRTLTKSTEFTLKIYFINHYFSNSSFSRSELGRRGNVSRYLSGSHISVPLNKEGERRDQSQNNFMGWGEEKRRTAGFLKAFEYVIYIPVHTIFASIYLSPLLNKTQNFPFPPFVTFLKQWDSDSSLFQVHD